jgi:hypothetical protein
MVRGVIECWLLLLYFDCVMRLRTFRQLHATVRDQGTNSKQEPRPSHRALSRAMDLACVFYFKRVLCLQRSAATAILLRRHGWKAEMVIGAQLSPFQSHAWVEIDGSVVNDKPYVADVFQVLERC